MGYEQGPDHRAYQRYFGKFTQAINDGVKYIVLTTIDYKTINESGLLEQHPDVKVVHHTVTMFAVANGMRY